MALIKMSNLLNLNKLKHKVRIEGMTKTVWQDRKPLFTSTETTRSFQPISKRQWRSSQSDSHRPGPSTAPGLLRFSHLFVRETIKDVQRTQAHIQRAMAGGRGSFRLHTWAASGSISANSSHQWWWLHGLSTKHAGRGRGQQIVSLSTSRRGGGGNRGRGGI